MSDNTADNDLWGHVLYGQRMIHLGALERTDPLSWTAAGAPWINHEVIAELILGAVHLLAGAVGLWGLMIALGAVTLGWAWRLGGGSDPTQRAVALALLALLGNAIALGYAVRPQLFTYLGFVALLACLRAFFAGRRAAGFLLAPLLALWVNTHGGYLAGWIITLAALSLEIVARFFRAPLQRLPIEPTSLAPGWLALAMVTSTVVLLLNPWGFQMILWTFETVRLPRPTIPEWLPMPLTAGSLPFFFALVLGAVAWIGSRRPRHLSEMAIWLLCAVMAVQHQRHAPLFGLASVVLLPAHLTDLLVRLAPSLTNLLHTLAKPLFAGTLAFVAVLAGAGLILRSVGAPRVHSFRMEVPHDLFPVHAIEYLRSHRLTGNTVTFFDWGQQVLWELPDNPVSFDGRLDTVYSSQLMDAHWQLYAGKDPGPALDLERAEVALLAAASPADAVLRARGWTEVYRDPLALVLVRRAAGSLPIEHRGADAITGRTDFPDAPPALAKPASRHTP